VLLWALLLGADPAPGLVDPSIVALPAARAEPREGTPREALAAFLEAHALHRAGEGDAALVRYLEFLAVRGAAALPARYRATAEARAGRLLEAVARAYEGACALYRRDRAAGLDALRALAARHDALPQARAARVLLATDALRAAIDEARTTKDPKPLERAVREHPLGLFQYEARALLAELGGPDLRPKERPAEESTLEAGR
jgi:tetratricopeptide (TPR) repeat protein